MIGRSIVDTTVRSSAATNTLKPTTARIAAGDGRRRVGVDGVELNHCRWSRLSASSVRTLAGGSIVERVAVAVELERPVATSPPSIVVSNSAAVTRYVSGWIQRSTATSWPCTSPTVMSLTCAAGAVPVMW